MSAFTAVVLRFASSQLIANLLRLLSGFLVIRLIEPKLYGEFTGIGISLGFILLSHGGIVNGLGRELPLYLGSGKIKESKLMASSVMLLSAIVGVVSFCYFFFQGVRMFFEDNQESAMIYFSYSIVGLVYLFNKQTLPVLYRTTDDFKLLSKQYLKIGILNITSVLLIFFYGFYGLIIRASFIALVEFFMLFRSRPINLSFQFDIYMLIRLMKIGFPILAVGYVNIIWLILVNTAIFRLGGAESFGIYGLSNIVYSALGILPSSFSQVIYPKMTTLYGDGKSIKAILSSVSTALITPAIIMLLIGAAGFVLIPLIVEHLLPEYSSGIEAAKWILLVPVVQSFGLVSNIFNVVKKQFVYGLALIVGAVIGCLYIYFMIDNYGFSLSRFAKGILVGVIMQQIGIFFALFYLSRSKGV